MLQAIRQASRTIVCSAILTLSVGVTAQAENSMQTGDGLLMLKADMPKEVRVGEQFSYNVEVINSADNIILHDIKLRQRKAKGFTVESVSMRGKQDSSQGNEENNQSGSTGNSATDKSGEGQSSNSKSKMSISTLKPGESRTFVVKASADEEGELRSCLEIASYTPAMCLTSQVVKPQLELTKNAPKESNRCNVIELSYKVKNSGSGDVGKFTITDSLGEGLATIEGNSELSFPVDGLAAGETREFVARVYAKKPGKFSSRAVAKASDSDLKSRSKETTTNVIAADLTANVNGPSRVYGDDLAKFTATITNTGNVAAEAVNVTVHFPSKANMADMGEVSIEQSSSNDSSTGRQQSTSSEPTMAASNAASGQDGEAKNGQSSGDELQMQNDSFVIDRLEAGQTAEFTYAIRTDNLDKLPTKVVARYTCTVDAAEDQAKSTAKTTAMAMATVKIVRLPALQLAVVDDEDPVKDGSMVQYTIQVWNEGDAPDQNVTLVAKLPSNLKFDSADGPTDVTNEGSEVRFAPIKSMEPGDRAEFTVTAKPTGTGNARFEAALTSKMLQQEVIGEEPTRLFDSSNE